MATLTTLVSFDGTDGAYPQGSLIIDSSGNLYGTTYLGGADGEGTVFEIVATPTGYSSTPTTLVSFNNTDGADLQGSLIVDSSGDLYGTTANGGASFDGSVFEIADTLRGEGYSNTPRTLASFNNTDGETPQGSLIADSSGNLYGTASYGGANYDGTVFEIAETAMGYNSTPIVLAAFNGMDGSHPSASLLVDTSGNFYGTTPTGGANGYGTVFEIAKTATGYNSTPIALVSFNGTDGAKPEGSLITDASGNLYGTTSSGGEDDDGTVFEIAKTATGYNSTPIVLASFDGTDGEGPTGSLLMDAAGNLFGTTDYGGLNNGGTVFELANTESGYSNTPTTLVSFDDTDGALPLGSLIADAAGNLYGTTSEGGAYDDQGTVFEITDSGYQTPCYCRGTLILTERGEVPVEELAIGDRVATRNGLRPIKWVGRRSYDTRFIRGQRGVLPIIVTAGALAHGVPVRDLWVSPEHALYLDGALVPARLLVNGMTITQVDAVDRLEYFHIELDSHDVIFAEGTPAETYIECDNRLMFHNAAEFTALHPAAVPDIGQFCAPRLEEGAAVLTAIHARLLARAAALGHVVTDDPGLHLIADGVAIEPLLVEAGVYRFTLPHPPEAVHLTSRSAVPAETDAASTDRRRLGVSLRRITIRDANLTLDLVPEHHLLRDGFYEAEGGHRWTKGTARLPASVVDLFAGPLDIEIAIWPRQLRYAERAA